jgi:hypothetical protein
MRLAIKDDVFVHFVRQNNDIGITCDCRQLLQVVRREDLPAWVMRVLTMIIRVFGVMAARTSSQFTAKSGTVSLMATGVAPNRTIGA